MYTHIAGYGTPAPLALMVWSIAERFGWTLEYIDGLSITRLHELTVIDEARSNAQANRARRKG